MNIETAAAARQELAFMRIIYIHQFFVTNEGAWGTRSYDVCRHLAAKGHQITMIRGICDLSMDSMPWYRLFKKQRIAGFDVITCNVYFANAQGVWRRMVSYFWFAVLATIAACAVRRPDLIFATSLPLTVGIPGYVAARRHRAPFLFEVRDICPEGDVICGYLRKGSPVERALGLLEWFNYVKAKRLFLVSPGFQKRLIERGYDGRIMRTILLGADGELFENVTHDQDFRAKHGLEGKTIAVYTGAHGTANGLYYVLDAAEQIKDRDDIAFVLIGDGREKPALMKQAQDRGLTNVHFIDPMPKRDLVHVLPVCDIGLMILRYVGERPVTPNKIFDYMFAALPSIVNFPGPTWEMVERHDVGVYADPLDPADLAAKVAYWADHPRKRKAVGARARPIAYANYDRRRIAQQMEEAFSEAISGR